MIAVMILAIALLATAAGTLIDTVDTHLIGTAVGFVGLAGLAIVWGVWRGVHQAVDTVIVSYPADSPHVGSIFRVGSFLLLLGSLLSACFSLVMLMNEGEPIPQRRVSRVFVLVCLALLVSVVSLSRVEAQPNRRAILLLETSAAERTLLLAMGYGNTECQVARCLAATPTTLGSLVEGDRYPWLHYVGGDVMSTTDNGYAVSVFVPPAPAADNVSGAARPAMAMAVLSRSGACVEIAALAPVRFQHHLYGLETDPQGCTGEHAFSAAVGRTQTQGGWDVLGVGGFSWPAVAP
jgi:hypothetical protein